ncbi:hypothetical protein GC197_13725 [bacterium]|nr:hypothetical protein [bacterium]
MKLSAAVSTIILLGGLFSQIPCRAAQPGRLPVPTAEQQAESTEIIAEAFRAQYEEAKTSEDKLALAQQMLLLAMDTKDDPSGRFTLCRIAKDVAMQHGDLPVALNAATLVGKYYDIDPWAWRTDAVESAVDKLKLSRDQKEASEIVLQLSQLAIGDDRYDVANELAAAALKLANSGGDKTQIETCTQQAKRSAAILDGFKQAKSAEETLRSNPSDPAASAVLGKFYCFVLGDWHRGLKLLAQGSEPDLQDIAKKELEKMAEPLELGDAWWEIAESQDSLVQEQIKMHAGLYYHHAVASLSGLTQAKVRARLSSLPPIKFDDPVLKMPAAPALAKPVVANTSPTTPSPAKPTDSKPVPINPSRITDIWHNDTYRTTMTRQGKSWIERNDDDKKVRLTYNEVERDEVWVVLYCIERKNRMRLHKTGRAELEKNGQWAWVAMGHWLK